MQQKKFNEADIDNVLELLKTRLNKRELGTIIPFNEFLLKAAENPLLVFRSIFQQFSGMLYYYTSREDEYANDPENIHYQTINSDNLFVKNTDTPFFADLPLANRMLRWADALRSGAQQNKIYVFIGPPGSGKSTFLNNLLKRFEEYSNTPEGTSYEIFWRIDLAAISVQLTHQMKGLIEAYYEKYENKGLEPKHNFFEIPCPSHDHPFLIIPKEMRAELLERLIVGKEKTKIFNKKEYEWLFKKNPCTICSSIFNALIGKLDSPTDIFDMIYARKNNFNRRLGRGITIYNPADKTPDRLVLKNEKLQDELNGIFRDSSLVKYIYSRYANTNNGIFALMDVKGDNEKRFHDLHGIISEGIHKIDDIEENVNSLFIAIMNPEDKEKIIDKESFRDRIVEINVNYILNYTEEVKVYCNAFGKQISNKFLPDVLNNFAKIIISSRLNTRSDTMSKWIKNPSLYSKYCDENLLLLKLSIYNNIIPSYLLEEDRKTFTKELRRQLIDESESEGSKGFSGRESINIFGEFYDHAKKTFNETGGTKRPVLITMNHIRKFFEENDEYSAKIPKNFITSIIHMYDYNVMQHIKESLFHQNEERIINDIKNYLFALSYDINQKLLCPYTNETIEISDAFFNSFEQRIIKKGTSESEKINFRKQQSYKLTICLQDMNANGLLLEDTQVYKELYATYMYNLRENIFQPFLQYTSFENAIKEYGTPKFEVFDSKTKEEVRFLIHNLQARFNYTEEGALQVCLYVLENKIAEKFAAK
ncbi:MAG: serine protein kinase PrkA [Ignavibacteria bacterium]|nr:serine protein kinase PrkA [Ignavibacteria bacterium]